MFQLKMIRLLRKFLPVGANRVVKAKRRFSKELAAVRKGIEEMAKEKEQEQAVLAEQERAFEALKAASVARQTVLSKELDSAKSFSVKLAEFIQ